ncbi:hypothetical protein JIN84_08395 [Luteolibacter yonseiensis]|uniref:Uncharacterized protein n=1 Tax=Luteolibacter yonseiensis TaxID=1144680 RepID=A0A934V710_9BACT|nr:hypothetical protein [Luteolibacter yonseiensis]MBK1815632.1 hypothetical protein [Luteolibacter yonseiensis]
MRASGELSLPLGHLNEAEAVDLERFLPGAAGRFFLEAFQFFDALAFQIDSARPRIDRLGSEAVLNRESICHHPFENRIFENPWID